MMLEYNAYLTSIKKRAKDKPWGWTLTRRKLFLIYNFLLYS